jgi:hypothetical protein
VAYERGMRFPGREAAERGPTGLVLGQWRLAFSAMTKSPSNAPTAALATLRVTLSDHDSPGSGGETNPREWGLLRRHDRNL